MPMVHVDMYAYSTSIECIYIAFMPRKLYNSYRKQNLTSSLDRKHPDTIYCI